MVKCWLLDLYHFDPPKVPKGGMSEESDANKSPQDSDTDALTTSTERKLYFPFGQLPPELGSYFQLQFLFASDINFFQLQLKKSSNYKNNFSVTYLIYGNITNKHYQHKIKWNWFVLQT